MVKPGDVVRVKVLAVDVPRKRISLTLRLDDAEGQPAGRPERVEGGRPPRRRAEPQRAASGPPDTALADALRRAGLDTRGGGDAGGAGNADGGGRGDRRRGGRGR